MSNAHSEAFCEACITGDLFTVRRMLQEDRTLANSFQSHTFQNAAGKPFFLFGRTITHSGRTLLT